LTLVFVHPGAAARGPVSQIHAQVALVSTWIGPLVVLQDMDPSSLTGTGATLLAAQDAAIAFGKHEGPRRRIGSPSGGLTAAIVRLLQLTGTRCEFLVTGAGSAISETARLLERAGARVRVHPSAVTYDIGVT
jgi:hypothetical protein